MSELRNVKSIVIHAGTAIVIWDIESGMWSRRNFIAGASAATVLFGSPLGLLRQPLSSAADTGTTLLERANSAIAAGAGASIPTLDQMAGRWLKAGDILNPPALNNRRDMLQVRYDLISTRFNPGGIMMPQTVTGVPLAILNIDGEEPMAEEMRWSAYQASRRNLGWHGLQIETAVRMMQEKSAFLTRTTFTNPSSEPRHILVELLVKDKTVVIKEWPDAKSSAINRTLRDHWVTVFEPVQQADDLVRTADGVTWRWKLTLAAHGSSSLDYVVDSQSGEESIALAETHERASHFQSAFDDCRRSWEQRWVETFTPGNSHFSGSLPIFETHDAALSRIYYMSILTVLCCERSQYNISPRDFVTETDRPNKQYFWDASMMASVWALLEPEGMKKSLRAWLRADVLASYGLDVFTGTTMGPTWYAFSGTNIFHTVLTYVRVTGDEAFLDEAIEPGGNTVLWKLDEISLLWKRRVKPGQTLANWGGANNLLETGAPNYIGAVASLNAQSVGIMREMADLHALRGNRDRATQLNSEAARLLPEVLRLYRPGAGVWNSLQEDDTSLQQRHIVDFIYVSQAISSNLGKSVKLEMLSFVKQELLTDRWLRAESLSDPQARDSSRPDHGPMGSYDGWIPLAAAEMISLGDWEDGIAFLRRTVSATYEGPYAQAHEFCGALRMSNESSICVATGPTNHPFEVWNPSRGQTSRGYSSKECIAGGAFADVVIRALFGFQPEWHGRRLSGSDISRPFEGKLKNLRYRGQLFDLSAGKRGVAVSPGSNP